MLPSPLPLPLPLPLPPPPLHPVIYINEQADPPEQVVLDAANYAKQQNVDVIVGFGGGSSLDVAKVIALLAHPNQTQNLQEMYGVNQVKTTRLPLILIPTTAGTGSEVTPISIVTTGETTKMGIVSPVLYADTAILDATFTQNLPAHITAATGIDAMVH
ncbi:iron-containing alcohol dehydrogenase, partial [Klebsiella pneumoniae]|nr:iron-containing alcohol dehydrogenase [Klebsiella pneumoniae]